MTVYRRPDPIPRHTSRPASDVGLHAVRSETEDLHRLVSRQIFTAIASGAYPEGSILPNEDVLSGELGVSRTALRESVKGLVAKGILETRRRRGTLVLARSQWNLFDADIIAWLRRDDSRRVTDELLASLSVALVGAADMAARLRSAAALTRTSLIAGDASIEARAGFLGELGQAAGNRFIASLVATSVRSLIAEEAHRFDAATTWLTPRVAGDLADAVRAGDVETATRLMRRMAMEPALAG